MSQVLWILVMLGLALFVVVARIERTTDSFCEWCGTGINTTHDDFIEYKYAIELGGLRTHDYWQLCSLQCLDALLEEKYQHE